MKFITPWTWNLRSKKKEPEGAIEEQTMAAEERSVQGSVHIAEDVITELA